MKLFLVQHGEAFSEAENPRRPLTPSGRSTVAKTANFVKRFINIREIFHSQKLRAKETAEEIAKILNPSPCLREIEGLAPNDDPQPIKNLVEKYQEDLMVVGHMPHLARLASILLSGRLEPQMVGFRMGGILALEKRETGWQVQWMIIPELID
jgi:phosphohistidine phosphatase